MVEDGLSTLLQKNISSFIYKISPFCTVRLEWPPFFFVSENNIKFATMKTIWNVKSALLYVGMYTFKDNFKYLYLDIHFIYWYKF